MPYNVNKALMNARNPALMTVDAELSLVAHMEVRTEFEAWVADTNQGYDLTPCASGKMATYEDEKTEHAWRGFFHGCQGIRADAPTDSAHKPRPRG